MTICAIVAKSPENAILFGFSVRVLPNAANTSPLYLALLLLVFSCAACGSEGRASSIDAGDNAPETLTEAVADAQEEDEEESETERMSPVYDAEGVPEPHPTKLALGVAIPRGFVRVNKGRGDVVYRGPIAPQKVYRFYQRYLECSRITEAKRGWLFAGASPRKRGDTSRSVDVTIIKKGKHSQVVIIDRMGRGKVQIKNNKLQTFEDVRKAAHQGEATPRRPIPGTY